MCSLFIWIFLIKLAAARLLCEDCVSRPGISASEMPQPGNGTIQPHHSLPAATPKSTHKGTDNALGPSGCQSLTEGFGPLPEEDTPEAFRDSQVLRNISTQAVEPNGYTMVEENADGSIEIEAGYLGMEFLKEYNTTRCAELCDDHPLCGSFNIYFERDPRYDPSHEHGCPKPVSTNNIKCVLWKTPLTEKAVMNHGEIRGDFAVVITGSNLYNKKEGVLHFDDFSGPRDVDNNAAFEVPLEPIGGYNTRLSRDIFAYNSTLKSYNASVCASLCNRLTQRGFEEAPKSDKGPFLEFAFAMCNMFVAFELRRENKPVAMVCDSFSSVWSNHYQNLRAMDDLLVFKVSTFQREDYGYPAICAIKEHCKGDEYYVGGDCSGWGPGTCQHGPEDDGRNRQHKL